MRTPIWDFVRRYSESDTVRLHMPGHKGVGEIEKYDITEIKGADSLYEADGIIAESEAIASEIFGANTFYSAEGSSLSIRAMIYLALASAKKESRSPLILATRNAHRAFLSAVAMLDADVEWIGSGDSYMSCALTASELEARLSQERVLPTALYITAPDYLGNLPNVKELSEVCKRYGVLLLVDNAHGAYLKLLSPSRHPMDLGADMCTDSAHKTLPVITGGGYLHLRKGIDPDLLRRAKSALSLFGSSSPSYLILASLDRANAALACGFAENLQTFVYKIENIKRKLTDAGYSLVGDEPLKITVNARARGYRGDELAEELRHFGIEPEMAEPDYVVFMLSPQEDRTKKLLEALCSIPQREPLDHGAPSSVSAKKILSIREAILADNESLPLAECRGRILASAETSCPPAVSILMPGELVEDCHITTLAYYGKDKLTVVK